MMSVSLHNLANLYLAYASQEDGITGRPKKPYIDSAGYTDPPQICYMVAESLRDLL